MAFLLQRVLRRTIPENFKRLRRHLDAAVTSLRRDDCPHDAKGRAQLKKRRRIGELFFVENDLQMF